MKTRCTAGKRAMVVDGIPAVNLGKVIRVTHLVDSPWTVTHGPIWAFDGELQSLFGGPCYAVADAALLPLDDDKTAEDVHRMRRAGIPETLLTGDRG